MKIHLADSRYWKVVGADFKAQYVAAVKAAYKDAAPLLPFGSRQLNFYIQPKEWGIIPETGDYGYTSNSELIVIGFDPNFKIAREKVLQSVRSTVFHEMNHAARFHITIWHHNIVDDTLFEGLATVFERDYGQAKPLWGEYQAAEANKWFKELQKLRGRSRREAYMFKHPDGRRWIGYKTGTYLIDQAIKYSGKSVIELTQLECRDILTLAVAA